MSRHAVYGIGILLLLVASVFTFQTVATQSATNLPAGVATTNISPTMQPGDHVQGNVDAKVQLFVYMDLDCSSCKKFDTQTLPILRKQYPDELVVVYRAFPLSSRPNAFREAEAAECAYAQRGSEGFFTYITKLFLLLPDTEVYGPDAISETAQSIGLDTATFNTCLSKREQKEKVSHDKATGLIEQVRLTPTQFIHRGNTTFVVVGDHLDQNQEAIEYLLK